MAGIADRGYAELARHDVVRERCDVVLGDLAGDFLPSRGLTKRRRWLATASQLSSRGRIPPPLADRHLHPVDPLLDDLVHGLAPLGLRTFRSRKVSASTAAPVPLRP